MDCTILVNDIAFKEWDEARFVFISYLQTKLHFWYPGRYHFILCNFGNSLHRFFLLFFWLLQLKEIPGLAERMASLMSVDIDVEAGEEEVAEELSVDQIIDNEIRYAADEGYDSLKWLELEGLGIVDDSLLSLHLPSKFQARL